MKEDLVSVIVPIYKVEQYLEKCVNSIKNQTYKNLEIILVDDGSPDNCPALCDSLAKTDNRIKVIHKTNGGLSDARNVGFSSSTGKYISFVDSDDYLNTNFIETLYNNLINTDADMSICSFLKVQENENIDNLIVENAEIFEFDDSNKFEQLYGPYKLEFVTAWGKLYKREIFEKIKYPVGKINEDEFVCHHILSLCKKICYTDSKYYYYLQRQNSIMNQKYTEKNFNAFEGLYDRFLFFKENYPKLSLEALYAYLFTIMNKYNRFEQNCRKILMKNFKTTTIENKDLIKQLSKKRKFKLFLFKHFSFIF